MPRYAILCRSCYHHWDDTDKLKGKFFCLFICSGAENYLQAYKVSFNMKPERKYWGHINLCNMWSRRGFSPIAPIFQVTDKNIKRECYALKLVKISPTLAEIWDFTRKCAVVWRLSTLNTDSHSALPCQLFYKMYIMLLIFLISELKGF